ncbi:MAG: TetR/AcrR family transcriptional regulator [Eubacteriales bacterium]|nr:TetR/AcrR family transcriptional regulator [Eubacteriales bacterium]
MNEKFFALPQEKRDRIINAGYRIFSRNTYKKSPVGEIAAEAGISKSLLFHYFHNKKELYLFLWDEALRTAMQAIEDEKCYEPDRLFEMMYKGIKAKTRIMKKYPDLTAFVMKAFYEQEPETVDHIQKSYEKLLKGRAGEALKKVKKEEFREGLDMEMMYREMFWASEGYLWEEVQKGPLDAEKIEKDSMKMLEYWKQIYSK